MATITVKVVPGARKNRIVGKYGDAIKVQVSAPPEQGKANEAVVALLAKTLEVKPQQVRIVRGHGQPRKMIEIDGMDESTIWTRLAMSD
jgi:uncharacterized protein (TIGR00251 family)